MLNGKYSALMEMMGANPHELKSEKEKRFN